MVVTWWVLGSLILASPYFYLGPHPTWFSSWEDCPSSAGISMRSEVWKGQWYVWELKTYPVIFAVVILQVLTKFSLQGHA